MSKENVGRFFRFLSENKECQSKVKSFGNDIDAIAAYARELGYDISTEELQEHRNKALQLIKKRAQKVLQQPDVSLSPGASAFYKFVKLAETDGEVSKRVAELADGPPQAIIAYGKEKGFIFNERDMQTVGKDILKPSDELSDEDLELVAGGVDPSITAAVVVAFVAVAAAGILAAVVVAAVLSKTDILETR